MSSSSRASTPYELFKIQNLIKRDVSNNKKMEEDIEKLKSTICFQLKSKDIQDKSIEKIRQHYKMLNQFV